MHKSKTFIFVSPPLIVITLYILCIFTRESFLVYLLAYAAVVFILFILAVYILRMEEMTLYMAMRFTHLPASMFLADLIDEVWTRFGGQLAVQGHLWFYHLLCQVINCCTLILLRLIWD